MAPEPAIYLLLGYPGTGKYTVGTELTSQLVALGCEARLIDNHLVANPVFAITPRTPDGGISRRAFAHVSDMRAVVLAAIEELCPHDWSLVFTNYLQDDELNRPHAEGLAALAASRGNRFVPVVLSCDRNELLRRVGGPDRHARLKLTHPERAGEILDKESLFHPPGALHLDVTDIPPSAAAAAVIAHATSEAWAP